MNDDLQIGCLLVNVILHFHSILFLANDYSKWYDFATISAFSYHIPMIIKIHTDNLSFMHTT